MRGTREASIKRFLKDGKPSRTKGWQYFYNIIITVILSSKEGYACYNRNLLLLALIEMVCTTSSTVFRTSHSVVKHFWNISAPNSLISSSESISRDIVGDNRLEITFCSSLRAWTVILNVGKIVLLLRCKKVYQGQNLFAGIFCFIILKNKVVYYNDMTMLFWCSIHENNC